MYTCSLCSKEYADRSSFYRHRKIKHPELRATKVCIISTKKETTLYHFDKYCSAYKTCAGCGISFHAMSEQKYCGQSCAATTNNAVRSPPSDEQRLKTSLSMTGRRKPEHLCVRRSHVCKSCGSIFSSKKKKHSTCSQSCLHDYMSKIGADRQISKNFSSKIPGFSYNDIVVDCDSKLEAAAVIYLVDHCGAIDIERCTSILHYTGDDGVARRFLPDFYVRTATSRVLVEVKSVYKKELTVNDYNQNFGPKRKSLVDFGNNKGLETMWLDTDFDPRFKTIYRRVCHQLT